MKQNARSTVEALRQFFERRRINSHGTDGNSLLLGVGVKTFRKLRLPSHA
jgi:hypothetical protein